MREGWSVLVGVCMGLAVFSVGLAGGVWLEVREGKVVTPLCCVSWVYYGNFYCSFDVARCRCVASGAAAAGNVLCGYFAAQRWRFAVFLLQWCSFLPVVLF